MFVVAVANAKGGCGKTTVATQLAAHFARQGYASALADLDRQESAKAWLARRPGDAPRIQYADLSDDPDAELTKPVDRLVIDSVAAMKDKLVEKVVKRADLIVIPTNASAYDEDGVRLFIRQIEQLKPIRKNKRAVAFVANRVRPRTKAAARLDAFLAEIDFPRIAAIRDSQIYVDLAAAGLAVSDLTSARARNFAADWAPLLDFAERCAHNPNMRA